MPPRKRKAATKTASLPKKSKIAQASSAKSGKATKDKEEPVELIQTTGESWNCVYPYCSYYCQDIPDSEQWLYKIVA